MKKNSKIIKLLSKIVLAVLFLIPAFYQVFDIEKLTTFSYSDTKYKTYFLDSNSSVTPSEVSDYSSYEYVIDKYNVNISVNEDNTLDITEDIDAYFNVPKHGIYRKIPLKNKVTRLDGKTTSNRAKISNVSVNSNYETSRSDGFYEIKIGSQDKVLTGLQHYTIKYTYNLFKDTIKDYDELYFNIIGDQWDTVIGNVSFTVTMPKEFDQQKLGFSSGSYGSSDSTNISYNVDGTTITGSYDGILNKNEALTIRCELPEGYFVDATALSRGGDFLLFVIPVLFLIISLYLWQKYGRDDQVVETVEFYPPEGKNSLEVGFLYKGKAESKDITSLLIYLANKGYLKITDISKKSKVFGSDNDFKLTKIKDYDGCDEAERIFFEGLFKKKNEVTSSDLYDKFYKTMEKVETKINSRENKNKIYEKTASNKSIVILLMIIITYCIITIPPCMTYGAEVEDLIIGLSFPSLAFTFFFASFFETPESFPKTCSIGSVIVGFIVGIFGGIAWAAMILPLLLLDSVYLSAYIVGIICVFGMVIAWRFLPKRTPYGNEMLGKIRGFKSFLQTAEKEKLEAMVESDPTYFYDILPYTYVLGVSDKWIKKFEAISLQEPTWYDSPSAFDVHNFSTFINSTMTTAQTSMTSSPSSSSSSGGGFSGGGSGGGGGGSW